MRWIVDPIDGTVNYLYGLPYSAVSLAAEVDGVVVAGVVRNVSTGEEWTATAGGGAWRDGVRLRCSDEVDLGQALVGTGFGYDAGRRAHQAQVVAGLIAHVRDIRRLGAAALDLCLVAEGRLDAYFEKGLAAWDLAAGGLVAAEAGFGSPAWPVGRQGRTWWSRPRPRSSRRCTTGWPRWTPPAVPDRRTRSAGSGLLSGRLPALSGRLWPAGQVGAGRRPGAAVGRLRGHLAGGDGQEPLGASGGPESPSDWLTSVVVASCWKLLPSTTSTVSSVRFGS